MKKTFWNGDKEVNVKIGNAKVDWGYTENKKVNAVIAVNKIYYDMYNNGGCNLIDDYSGWNSEYYYLKELVNTILLAKVGHVFGNVNLKLSSNKIMEKLEKEDKDGDYFELEKFTDEIFKALESTDLTFKVYTTYFSNNKEEISRNKKGLRGTITFGLEENQEQWEKTRINQGFKLI